LKKPIIILLILYSGILLAHEVKPGYLEINEHSDGVIEVLWKVPLVGKKALSIFPVFSDGWLDGSPPIITKTQNAIIYRWNIKPDSSSLKDQTITIAGLEMTMTDVMVKVHYANGTKQIQILKPEHPSFALKTSSTGIAALDYMRLGIEHIMLGIDHLLFVFGLLLLSKTMKRLLQTITAFTIGHSISLALATLGFVNVPEKPLAVIIAMSILFLGIELLKDLKGENTLTIRKPWLVSFGFGIIHGLGFAGGLVKLGLPESVIPLALLFFNIGVEIGQVAFILIVLAMIASYKKMEFVLPNWGKVIPAYAIGSFAAFWFIGRIIIMIQ
jgi:hypothetical protein